MSGRRFGPEVGYSCPHINEGDSTSVWRPLRNVIARRISGRRKVVFLKHNLPILAGDSYSNYFSILSCGWKCYEPSVRTYHGISERGPVRQANWRTTRNGNLENVRSSAGNLAKVE